MNLSNRFSKISTYIATNNTLKECIEESGSTQSLGKLIDLYRDRLLGRALYKEYLSDPIINIGQRISPQKAFDINSTIITDFTRVDSLLVVECIAGSCIVLDNLNHKSTIHKGDILLLSAQTRVVKLTPESAICRLKVSYYGAI